MRLADRIAELARIVRRAERELVSGLSDEERDATGTPDAWAARPLYAHIVDFKLQQVQRLDALGLGTAPPTFPDLSHCDPAGDTMSHYNVACLYATTGRRDEALALLPEALSDPGLAAHAVRDPDLAGLRDYMPIAW